nr:MAG TPA: hypothetical protein [Caudoviricetes sp.]
MKDFSEFCRYCRIRTKYISQPRIERNNHYTKYPKLNIVF